MILQIFVLAATLVSTQAAAGVQALGNPVTDAARQSLVQQSKNLIDSAELMPPTKQAITPTDAQMTFGKLRRAHRADEHGDLLDDRQPALLSRRDETG
jgi:hypothetical protein